MSRRLLVNTLERLAPRYTWRRRIEKWRIETGEPEEQLLPWVCDPAKYSIDIGCAAGAYAARMLLYSSRVIAFEPQPDAAKELRELFRHTSILTVEEVALSDTAGTTVLRSPADRPMLSTIEDTNELAESKPDLVRSLRVDRKPLDAYNLTPVGFIKIDVEGHEINVLAGAVQTIRRERPALLIEIEQRHNPRSFSHISGTLAELGYSGFFLVDDKLVGTEHFSPEVHQNQANIVLGRRKGIYINNFLFLPKHRIDAIPVHLRTAAL
jgi:FkbM family methyltransferase